jgi:hypothetical protein
LSVDLGIVKVRGPRELRVSVAHVRRAALPVDVYVSPGDHAVQIVEGPGKGSKLARVTAGATVTITFDAPRPRRTAIQRAKPKPRGGNTVMQALGWTAIGLGVTSGVAAIVLGVKGLDARDEWEADLRNLDLRDRAETLRLWTNVAWGGAAVFSVTGVVLVVVEATSRETDSGSSAAAFGIGPFGGWLSASW